MITVQTTHELLQQAGQLAELTSTFQATYGRNYRINAGSDRDTWRLYRHIQDVQANIARLLTPANRDAANPMSSPWWERHDVPDASLAQAIVSQVGHLIAAAAYNAVQNGDGTRSIDATERAIAGMLHPSVLMVVADEPVSA